MKQIVNFIRRLVGKEESVESIMAPLTKIADKLEAHEQAQRELVVAQRLAAEKAQAAADAASTAARTAAAKRAKMLETFA